jgi:hypothetical protein
LFRQVFCSASIPCARKRYAFALGVLLRKTPKSNTPRVFGKKLVGCVCNSLPQGESAISRRELTITTFLFLIFYFPHHIL